VETFVDEVAWWLDQMSTRGPNPNASNHGYHLSRRLGSALSSSCRKNFRPIARRLRTAMASRLCRDFLPKLFLNRIDSRGPDEGLWVFIPRGEKLVYGLFQTVSSPNQRSTRLSQLELVGRNAEGTAEDVAARLLPSDASACRNCPLPDATVWEPDTPDQGGEEIL
jgi:hypothetical protein